jgi:TRAP-type C4-dicarboxylate transport system permease small subunit
LQKTSQVKKLLMIWMLFLALLLAYGVSRSQCSICTRTVQQLGEKPARALNAGIIYLAFMPMTIIGYIGWRWWRSNHREA